MQQPGGRPARVFCDVNIACLLIAILVILCSCFTAGFATYCNIAYATTICFIAPLIAIIAFFLRNPMAGSNVLVWLYFIAGILNGVGFLCVSVSLCYIGIGKFGSAIRSNVDGIYIVALFVLLLGQLAVVVLFEYAIWVIYKDIKTAGKFLPSHGGGSAPLAQPNPPVVVVSAPPPVAESGGSRDAKAPSSGV